VSERTRRLDHLLTEEISRILSREVQDPRIGFVTITGVKVTPDLRHATVWASIIGDERERRTTLRALESAMPYVRRHLGELRLKRIPDLHVREDDSAERGTRIMELLERIETEEAGGTVTDPEALSAELSSRTLPTPGPRPAEEEARPRRRSSRVTRPTGGRAPGTRSTAKGGRQAGGKTRSKGGDGRSKGGHGR
jgi:ribosome-binding factor A